MPHITYFAPQKILVDKRFPRYHLVIIGNDGEESIHEEEGEKGVRNERFHWRFGLLWVCIFVFLFVFVRPWTLTLTLTLAKPMEVVWKKWRKLKRERHQNIGEDLKDWNSKSTHQSETPRIENENNRGTMPGSLTKKSRSEKIES